MLLEKPINKNKKDNQKRREVLYYLALIKFWAMILIIRFHIYQWKKRRIKYGQRMCEFLFISSGFLVGYNYFGREMPSTYQTSFKYAYKHLRLFYPLHIINSLFCIYSYKYTLNLTYYEMLILNFLLLKVWSRKPKYTYGFNGISWFVSALSFCYFLCPLLLRGIQNIYNSLIIFFFVSLIRVSFEQLIENGSENILDLSFHYSPIIRLMEFFLGMLLIPLFLKIKCFFDKTKNKLYLKYFFSLIQIIFPIIIYFIMLEFDDKLIRCYFVLIFCVFIFLISYDYGCLSNIMKIEIFKKILSCQMEMYLLQNTLNSILINILNNHWTQNAEFNFLIKIVFIFIISYIYRKLFREKLAIFMDKIVALFKKIFI